MTLLDATTGRATGSLPEPSFGGVGYLHDGRWLVVTSNDPHPEAQLYDATTLTSLGVPYPTADVDQHELAVDPAGTRFSQTVAKDYATPTSWDPYLWSADPSAWIHDACAIAGRNLTRAEWHQYLPDRPYRRTCTAWPAAT